MKEFLGTSYVTNSRHQWWIKKLYVTSDISGFLFFCLCANLCHPKKSKGHKVLLSFQVKNETAISTQK